MEFPVNLEMWQLVVGALLPGLVAFLKNMAWPDYVKIIILFGLSCLVAVAEIFIAGQFTAGNFIGNALKVAFLATAAYAWIWKPTGADAKVAKSIGLGVAKPVAKVGMIFLIAMVFVLPAGCVSESAWKGYAIANTEFTEIAEQYEAYYQLQNDATKVKWQAKFDPVFLRGDQALTDWRKVLNAGEDPAAQKAAFNTIKTDIIMILFELSKD